MLEPKRDLTVVELASRMNHIKPREFEVRLANSSGVFTDMELPLRFTKKDGLPAPDQLNFILALVAGKKFQTEPSQDIVSYFSSEPDEVDEPGAILGHYKRWITSTENGVYVVILTGFPEALMIAYASMNNDAIEDPWKTMQEDLSVQFTHLSRVVDTKQTSWALPNVLTHTDRVRFTQIVPNLGQFVFGFVLNCQMPTPLAASSFLRFDPFMEMPGGGEPEDYNPYFTPTPEAARIYLEFLVDGLPISSDAKVPDRVLLN